MIPATGKFPGRWFWAFFGPSILVLVGAIFPMGMEMLIRGSSRFNSFIVVFNVIPFAVVAACLIIWPGKPEGIDATSNYLRKIVFIGAAVVLVWINILMHINILTTVSSTAGFGYLALLIFALALIPVGYVGGWLVGKLYLWSKNRPAIVYTSNIAIAALFVGSLLYLTDFGRGNSPPEVGVVSGAELLHKEMFFENRRIGRVTSITVGRCHSNGDAAITIVGRFAFVFVTRDGSLLSGRRFAESGMNIVPIDLESDGVCEFMDRGGVWHVSLYDDRGRKLWSYSSDVAPDKMAAGDLDGDGRLEFVVGSMDLRLLDEHGNLKWKREATSVWHVEILDTNGDGTPEIVHSNSPGLIIIRDAEGNILRQFKAPSQFFSLTRWPNAKGKWYALGMTRDNHIQLIDFDGKMVVRYRVPRTGPYVQATPVQFEGEESPFFAAVVSRRATEHRSILYVFDNTGQLLYQEVFAATEPAVTVLRSEESGAETLLVGGDGGKVWEYKLKTNPR